MKKSAGLLLLLAATACLGRTRDWKPAKILSVSETNVSGPLIRETSTMHYTIETEDLVLFLDYSYHPSGKTPSPDQHNKNGPPGMAENGITKIAVEGRHVYVVDNTGAEVKMHITKKVKK